MEFQIQLNSIDEVVNFVDMMEQYEYSADAKYGSIILDAKSFMGLISLGLGRKIQIRVHGERDESFAENMELFKAS